MRQKNESTEERAISEMTEGKEELQVLIEGISLAGASVSETVITNDNGTVVSTNQYQSIGTDREPIVLDGEAMPSEAEMTQEIIKKFQMTEAVLGMHEGMIVDSNLAQEQKHD
jgi:transcriptional regulator of NAD metabolism